MLPALNTLNTSQWALIISAAGVLVAVVSFILNWKHTDDKFKQTQYPNLELGLELGWDESGKRNLIVKCHNTTQIRAVNIEATVTFRAGVDAKQWRERLTTGIASGENGYYKTNSEMFWNSFGGIFSQSLLLDRAPKFGEPSASTPVFKLILGKECPEFYVSVLVRWSPPLWKPKQQQKIVYGKITTTVKHDHSLEFHVKEGPEVDIIAEVVLKRFAFKELQEDRYKPLPLPQAEERRIVPF